MCLCVCGSGIKFLELFNVDHDFQSSSELDSEALDKRLMCEEKQCCAINLLVSEDGSIVSTIGGALKKLDNLSGGPGADIHW